MKFKYPMLLTTLFATFSLIADAKPILEYQGVTFTDEELFAAVADQSPKYRDALEHDETMLNAFLKRLFLSRLIAEKYRDELLKDKQTKIALKLNEERNIHEMVIKKKFLEKIAGVDFKKLAMSEYTANADMYRSEFNVDFYHVLFLKEDNLSDIDPKEKAQEVLANIRDGKTTMAKAAKKYTMPLAGTNDEGVVKGAKPSALMPKIQQALAIQKLNEVSEVIETNMGYHIISLVAIHKPKTIEFHEPLQAKIIGSLEKKLQTNVTNEVTLPYSDIDKYTIHQNALKAAFDKIRESK